MREGLESVIAETEADELIVAAAIHDHSARVRSYELLATVRQGLGALLAGPPHGHSLPQEAMASEASGRRLSKDP